MRANPLCTFLPSALIAVSATSPAPAQNTSQAGDERAQKFDCKKDKAQVIGNKGRAAELAAPK